MDCIFCKIVSGQIQSKILQESSHSMAFLDTFPIAKGHTLVIPKKHHMKIQDMSNEENSDLFLLVHKILPKIDSLTGATLIAIHNGKEAGQEIPHTHIHLVPRTTDDSAGPIHSMFNTVHFSDSEIEEIYNILK